MSRNVARWLLVVLLSIVAVDGYAFWHNTTASRLVNFDMGVHLTRSIRVYYALRDQAPGSSLDERLRWAGALGNHHDVNLEGNYYPPLVYFLTAAIFFVTGPSARAGMLVMIPFGVLLVLASWGLARTAWQTDVAFVCAAIAFASPEALDYTHTFMLDLPLGALAAASLWMLLASEGFRHRSASLWLGLALGFGSLVKPTFALFVLLPLAWDSLCVIFARFCGRRPALWFAFTLLACALYLHFLVAWVGITARISAQTHDLGKRTLNAMLGAATVWAALRSLGFFAPLPGPAPSTPEDVSRTSLAPPEAATRWNNAVDAGGIALVLAASWYFVCAPLITGGLFENNPVEPSGWNQIGPGLVYYIWSMKNDLLLFPFFLLAMIGLPLGLTNRTTRKATLCCLLAMLGVIPLAIHGGRLSRYILPLVAPLAFLATVPLSKLGPRTRQVSTILVLAGCLFYAWSWAWPLDNHPRRNEWGTVTNPHSYSFLPQRGFPGFAWLQAPPLKGRDDVVLPIVDAVARLIGNRSAWFLVAPAPDCTPPDVNLHPGCFEILAESHRIRARFTAANGQIACDGHLTPDFNDASTPQDGLITILMRVPPLRTGPFLLRKMMRLPEKMWSGVYLRSKVSTDLRETAP